jgi:hypothetical protein
MKGKEPMRHLGKRRLIPVAIGLVAVVALSGAAYAFWTSGGTGNGSADVSTTTSVTVNLTSTIDDMYPGDSAQTLSGDFTNPNPGPVFITSVTVSISSVTLGGLPAPACSAADFTLTGAVMAVGAEIPNGTGGSWGGATIQFNDTASNQDGCKGATVNFAFVAA